MLNKDREDEARLLPGAIHRYDFSRRAGIERFTCGEGIHANGSFFGDNRPKGAFEIKPGAIRANKKPGVCVDCYLSTAGGNSRLISANLRLRRRFNLRTGYLMHARAAQFARQGNPEMPMGSSTVHIDNWMIHMTFKSQIVLTSGGGIMRARDPLT
jgi:hypothetical protein